MRKEENWSQCDTSLIKQASIKKRELINLVKLCVFQFLFFVSSSSGFLWQFLSWLGSIRSQTRSEQ